MRALLLMVLVTMGNGAAAQHVPCSNSDPLRQPFFGDTHVHTAYSFDARSQDTRGTPEDAYRFAKGEPLRIQPYDENGVGQRVVQIDRPLDFTAVTDHAELLGEVAICNTEGMDGYWHPACFLHRHFPSLNVVLFGQKTLIERERWGFCDEDKGDSAYCFATADTYWQKIQQAAAQAYDESDECSFTSFIGYEWTATVESGVNLHRNVIFKNDRVPSTAKSWVETPSAVDLWDYLEKDCVEGIPGCDALTIPHNSNISGGLMFESPLLDSEVAPEEPLTAELAARRARWEPLIEITQHKGESECDSRLDIWAGDEYCGEEKFSYDSFGGKPTGFAENIPMWAAPVIGLPVPQTKNPGEKNFVRYALKQGLEQQATLGVNSLKFGITAATDTHIAAPGLTAEKDHPGHGGAGKAAGEGVVGLPDDLENGPGGLTVLWAEENTRESLFAAMQRKEAYATSGTRPILRFFGGYELSEALCDAPDMVAQAYAKGVPMGADLPSSSDANRAPKFLVSAIKDPGTQRAQGTPLQRLQIVKGWYRDGQLHEKVVDVAGGDTGATVNLSNCERIGSGHDRLCSVWQDPDFNAQDNAFYYARVLENPSCRWSQFACNAAGVDCSDPDSVPEAFAQCCSAQHQPTVQERAWSSPIWFNGTSASGL